MRPTTAKCAHCGTEFPVTSKRGPLPMYCRRSHRQRAWEAKTFKRRDNKSAVR